VLGCAVIGLGIGEQHARTYAALGGARLTWLCDLDFERAARLARELGRGEPVRDARRVLEDASTSVVSIASFDDAHFAQLTAALAAGKNVFVEKPLCRSMDELREVKRVWAGARRPHLRSNLVLRAAPLYRWLREKIGAGEFGRIYAFDGDYLYGRLHKITEGWRKDVADYSVMQGGGIHMADLMLWLTGEKPLSVSAAGNRISTEGTAFRYDDFVSAVYGFPSGLIGRITANFGCVHRHRHVVRVFGTEATFLYDDQGPRLYRTREAGHPPEWLGQSALPGAKGDLIPPFVEAIQHGEDAAGPAQTEFDLASVCFAADKAAQTGRSEEIEYV
jgi:predicted dehydrogenase